MMRRLAMRERIKLFAGTIASVEGPCHEFRQHIAALLLKTGSLECYSIYRGVGRRPQTCSSEQLPNRIAVSYARCHLRLSRVGRTA